MLMNIGFVEARKQHPAHHAYVFHDVDKLPEDLCNIYSCARQPRHLTVAKDVNNYM